MDKKGGGVVGELKIVLLFPLLICKNCYRLDFVIRDVWLSGMLVIEAEQDIKTSNNPARLGLSDSESPEITDDRVILRLQC